MQNVKTDVDPSGWRPYHTFVDTLREKYLKNEAAKGTPLLSPLFCGYCPSLFFLAILNV